RGFRLVRQRLPARGDARLRECRPLRLVGGKFRMVKTGAAKLPRDDGITGMGGELFLRAKKFLFSPRGKRPVGGHLPRRGKSQRHQQKNCETLRPEWCWQWHDTVN